MVHWEDPEGLGGEGGGRGEEGSGWGTHVNPWLIHVNVWQKPLPYCKVISLQLIKKKKLTAQKKKKRQETIKLLEENIGRTLSDIYKSQQDPL